MSILVESFFHQQSATFTYLVSCRLTKTAMLIDSVADFNVASGVLSFKTANDIIHHIAENELILEWILESHAHADHITAASYIKQQLGSSHPCKLATGSKITQVQQHFSRLYDIDMPCDGSQFERLFNDNEHFMLGELRVTVIATPGHTPDSVCYLVEGNLFVGDTFFMPDSGTARCDFPGGSAKQLYDSLQRILALPDQTTLWMCHDYQPNGRQLANRTTVAQQRKNNIHLQSTEQDYISTRQTRDASLNVPALLHPAIQMNIRAGQLPQVQHNAQRYLTIPLTVLL
ncbi:MULTISPECIES: MBL fold metallo-hydrolase [Pseudoalteromonas]|uniref:MBL fold metallo-hydrolase n=1 Tax=Pseudoalteromonas haloplanktis TaxID=228 RepID=A0ABU1BGE7_PSEHA|nr:MULTISPECIES: MBL fold metallo-hydrolase [Pseudoalteromonas]MDQ9093553.1 MBL fold metallo-hydrolase [Pseudoalteromonas haloplanktis]TMN65918.1 MBL fold metallo-hydrolase [Pseudoalteromonas sp. S1727]